MVLVLVVIAAASIIAYGVIASATISSKVTDASTTRLQRQYLAESGLNLATYYLHNPSASPVSPIYGKYGNVHYPGEPAIQLGDMPGTVSLSVQNTANGVFDITSTGTFEGESITAIATIRLDKSKHFTQAANFLSSVTLNNKVTITGGAISVGNITLNTAAVTGLLFASNGESLGGRPVPATVDTRYPLSVTHYLPHYFYKGKQYTAKKLTGTNVLVTLLDANIIDNPCNVWYTEGNVTFLLVTAMSGTLIVTNDKTVTVQGSITITPKEGMPGLVVTDSININGNNRTLAVNGPVYVANQIRGTGTTTNSVIDIRGVLISGNTTGTFFNNYNGHTTVAYDPANATISGIMDEVEDINGVLVETWNTNNGSIP